MPAPAPQPEQGHDARTAQHDFGTGGARGWIGYPRRMVPVRLRVVARLASCIVVLALASCGEPASAPAPATPKTEPAPAAKQAPAPTNAAKPTTPTDAATPSTPTDTPTPAGEDWLVWFREGDQWVTRWISATASEPTLVAERRALVLSDGTRLWSIERKDGDVGIRACECMMEEDAPPDCSPRARLTMPGLRAVELVGGAELPVRAPATDDLFGDGIETSLEIVGGVGSRLFFAWGESGYMCGAHGTISGGAVVFDLAAGKAVDDPFTALGRALPAATREPAGTEIHARLQECGDGDELTLRKVTDEQMDLDSLHVSLAAGTPTITWHYVADTYYACSPDYFAHGTGTSGLVPAAAPLGLDGSLPGGVAKAMASIGEAPTVGWARLALTDPARTAALEAFRRAPEAAWPPAFATDRAVDASDPQVRREARAKLDEGRRLTRAGDHATAIATFDAAIAKDPKLARAWSERGYAKLLAGDLAGAKADLEAALPLDEGAAFKAAVHYNLGQVAERGGDVTAAKAAYEASLALRDHETVRKALARLP